MIDKAHIMPHCVANNADALTHYLSRLSNADFRKAEKIIREDILPTLPLPTLWDTLRHLVLYRPAAFVTGIVALQAHTSTPSFTLLTPQSADFAQAVGTHQPSAIPKIINIALPHLTTVQQIEELFQLFDIHYPDERIPFLIKTHTPLIYFVLFNTLKMLPDNSPLIRQCCIHILQRRDDQSVNMANILRTYFDIHNLPPFSTIPISVHELSYLDRDYHTFTHILNGRPPRI